MKYFYDTEFIDNGKTIDLISIGIVAEDGREFYSISNEFDESKADNWVKENVISKLPERLVNKTDSTNNTKLPRANLEHFLWKSREQIKEDIIAFIGDNKPEFWAYYADYDHVVFCQLFGRMMDLPKNFPMYTNDIKQLCNAKGNPRLPEKGKGEHHALADAKWVKSAYDFLNSL